ncbi:uncharacterized protein BXZ73DRAFT_20704, partial [Epithele typhae]|uniref:uncharacterized protein n=1 Tax=Epithele typhae TaxID=378194 RepID=UPI002007CC20
LAAMPFNAVYGISYDIFTRATEDELPDGWNSPRAHTYRRLIKYLLESGYTRHQYSDYRNENTDATETFLVMFNMRNALARNKLATTVKG